MQVDGSITTPRTPEEFRFFVRKAIDNKIKECYNFVLPLLIALRDPELSSDCLLAALQCLRAFCVHQPLAFALKESVCSVLRMAIHCFTEGKSASAC